MRFAMSTALALLLISQTAVVGAERVAPKQFVVSPSLLETYRKGSKREEKILSDPNLMLVANREANFSVGGEKELGAEKVVFGTTFKVKVEPVEGKTVRVTGVMEVSNIVSVSELSSAAAGLDDEIVPRESFSVHFAKTVTLGKKLRIRVSNTTDGERWFELLVEEATGSPIVNNAGATPTAVAAPVANRPISSSGNVK